MKHKVKALVPVEKATLFGRKKTVYEKRDILVDSKTYREMKKRKKAKPYSIIEMVLYDEICSDSMPRRVITFIPNQTEWMICGFG